MKVPVRSKIIIQLVSLILILGAIIYFVLIPNAMKILKLQSDINQNQQFLEEQWQKSKHLKKSMQEFDTVKKEVEKYSAMTMKEGEELKIITELEAVAEKNNIRQNLELGDISNEEDPDIGLKFYKFSFRNYGTYHDLVKYLKDIEELPYFINIDTLRFQRGSGNKYNAQVGLNFEGTIYVEK
ncbi:MAG: hypothetical protein GF349_05050 [Candidatus Magasanikbacteria bacterium]|nr:hypothetical protein [Candidatus Magasanikbacteria bacterium]